MSKEAVVQLFRATQIDPALKKELNDSPSLDAFVNTAKKKGYNFTAKEWSEATSFTVEELEGELSAIPGL